MNAGLPRIPVFVIIQVIIRCSSPPSAQPHLQQTTWQDVYPPSIDLTVALPQKDTKDADKVQFVTNVLLVLSLTAIAVELIRLRRKQEDKPKEE